MTFDVVLSTGAMENIISKFLLMKICVPFEKLCAVAKINYITHRTIESGMFQKSQNMQKNFLEAINIQVVCITTPRIKPLTHYISYLNSHIPSEDFFTTLPTKTPPSSINE